MEPHPHLAAYYHRKEERPGFVARLFDRAAPHYDRVNRLFSLGSGQFYRRRALKRWGLAPGARLLDLATGTGLLLKAAREVAGDGGLMLGLDLSPGMLLQARGALRAPLVLGTAEHLPLRPESFDFLTMGYGLRHVEDLDATLREAHRVLRPGGRILLLEVSQPRTRVGRFFLRLYLGRLVPFFTHAFTRSTDAELMMRYFWDTIEGCVPPSSVMDSLTEAGFQQVERYAELGVFSEYTGVRPPEETGGGDGTRP